MNVQVVCTQEQRIKHTYIYTQIGWETPSLCESSPYLWYSLPVLGIGYWPLMALVFIGFGVLIGARMFKPRIVSLFLGLFRYISLSVVVQNSSKLFLCLFVNVNYTSYFCKLLCG